MNSVITSTQIAENLDCVQNNIRRAAQRAGRDPAQVRLVVVTKAQPVSVIRAAYDAGIRCFGENYPQETQEKVGLLSDLDDVEWHMIGHLQSRKAPIVARHFQMIHSIDRYEIAVKLNRALEGVGAEMPALLEVNIGGEESKYGWSALSGALEEHVIQEFKQIVALPNLIILGLMTMPPLFDHPEKSRPFFQQLRNLAKFLQSAIPNHPWNELSMGTSVDYEVAIEEGATMVRIGQAILGPRPDK